MSVEKLRENSRRYYHNNKEKCLARHKEWVGKNKDYVREKQKENKRLRKLEAIEYMGGVCKHCSQKLHPSVYEFHHLNPEGKDRDPSKMLQLSKARLFAELDKCILLCANCHRYAHHGDKY